MTTKKLLSVALISSIVFNFTSCTFNKVNIIQGTDDYIPIPKGTEISVPLNIEGEAKTYKIITQKSGAWYSVEAQKEVLQARAK